MRHPLRAKARDGDAGALVLPEAPVRDRLPWAPAVRWSARFQPPADAVVAAVLYRRVVHRHDHEFRRAVTVEIGDGDPGALVFPEIPVSDRGPGPPGAHRPVGMQRATAVVALVTAGRRVHHENGEIELAVAVHICDSDVPAR